MPSTNDPNVPASDMWEGYEESVKARSKNLSEKRGRVLTTGYPHGGPKYRQYGTDDFGFGNDLVLEPEDHFNTGKEAIPNPNADNSDTFFRTVPEHFIRDINTPYFRQEQMSAENVDADLRRNTRTRSLDGDTTVSSFSGATTNINPFHDPNVDDIAVNGLWNHEKDLNNGKEPRVSPLLPFTRLNDPDLAQATNFYYYNRTKIPVADLEWRKGFRHIFITRPECYIMSKKDSQIVLSEQCECDREFASIYYQYPHIARVLSPHYITGDMDNFNYLLSNRVISIGTSGTNMSLDESVQKSIDGFTVQPAKLMTSNQGATIDLTFRDTKSLDVYNMLRAWMLYEYKTYKGVLAPSYNEYKYSNTYNLNRGDKQTITKNVNTTWQYMMHPYDRALDYCATIFDVITNESGNRILYWCKYYGVYPVSASPSLSNQNNGSINNEMTISAQFKYQRKMEMNHHTFIEFNYNAGLVNPDGSLKYNAQESVSFMYYDDPNIANSVSVPSKTYLGAAGMFVGTPYVVLDEQVSSIDKSQKRYIPYLQFKPMYDREDGYDYQEMNNYTEYTRRSGMKPTAFTNVATNNDSNMTQKYATDYYSGYEQARENNRRINR